MQDAANLSQYRKQLREALNNEFQREALDKLLVLGTLLEGHADHVMDAVGPVVVPSVATIRRQPPGTWLPLRVARGDSQLDLVVQFPPRP